MPFLIMLIAIVIISVVASSHIIMHFISFTEKYEQALMSSALADLGIQRSIYRLQKEGLVVPVDSIDHYTITEGSGSVLIDIACNNLDDYTITSTAGNKTIQASYVNGRITDWR